MLPWALPVVNDTRSARKEPGFRAGPGDDWGAGVGPMRLAEAVGGLIELTAAEGADVLEQETAKPTRTTDARRSAPDTLAQRGTAE